MVLPPNSVNILQLRAHLQVMLCKAADCEGPPCDSRDITNFEWHFRGWDFYTSHC